MAAQMVRPSVNALSSFQAICCNRPGPGRYGLALYSRGRLQLFDAWDTLAESLRRVDDDMEAVPAQAVLCRNPQTRSQAVGTRVAWETQV